MILARILKILEYLWGFLIKILQRFLPGIRSEKQFYAQKTNTSVSAYEMKNNCRLFEMLSNEIRMAFSFLEYLFSFTDVNVFALCKLGKWWCHRVCNLKMEKYWIKKISGNVKAVLILQTWHQKYSSQKKPNNIHSVIVMETLSFCQKPNILIFNPLK